MGLFLSSGNSFAQSCTPTIPSTLCGANGQCGDDSYCACQTVPNAPPSCNCAFILVPCGCTVNPSQPGCNNFTNPQDPEDLIRAIYDLSRPIAIVLGVLIIIVSGYTIMTSQGDPRAVQNAKENLTSGIMGLIFILVAVSLLRIIISSLVGF